MTASRYSFRAALCASLCVGLVSTAAVARAPSDLAYIEGLPKAAGEGAMRSHGYDERKTTEMGGHTWHMWRNKYAAQQCVGVRNHDGRVVAVQGFAESDCKGSDAAGAAAGVAVAAILGAALLSHHEDSHPSGNHYTNANHEASYERGYNDGLYGHSFVNYDHDTHYSDGYNAGRIEREHRGNAYRSSYYSGRSDDSGALNSARHACAREAADYWGLPHGSAHALSAQASGGNMYEVEVVAGYNRGTCTVGRNGSVKYIMNHR